MKYKRLSALLGLTLGLVGGITTLVDPVIPRSVYAESENIIQHDEFGHAQAVIDKPVAPEQMKQVLLDNAEAIRSGDLIISNQTGLSGHITEVLAPLFDKLPAYSGNSFSDRFISQLTLANDDLNSQDFKDLMMVIKNAPAPSKGGGSAKVISLDLSNNHISDYSSDNQAGDSGYLWMEAPYQKVDPDVKMPTLTVNEKRTAIVPYDRIYSLFNYGTPYMWQNANQFDEGSRFYLKSATMQSGNHFEDPNPRSIPLDYSKNGWAQLADSNEAREGLQRVALIKSDPVKWSFLTDYIREDGYTVDQYEALLKKQLLDMNNLVVNNIPQGAKTIDLRVNAHGASSTGVEAVYRFSLASSSSGSSTPVTPSSSSAASSSQFSSSTPITPSVQPDQDKVVPEKEFDRKIADVGQAVYSLKKVYLYKDASFNKGQRIASYTKKPRINRPMFVVTGHMYSNNGRLRYQVRDVNHHSKTAGKKGYITADWSYVRPVYYRSEHQTLTVINPKGVNSYKNKNLTGKIQNFKQGSQLKVESFVKHNLTTRYRLSNGRYITGNRKLVTTGKQKQPKQIKVKKIIYRYNNANFGKRLSKVKKGTVLKVRSWEYSHPYLMTTFGVKRYQVTGGYVTANGEYTEVVK
ncbi:hypothetical protein KTE19_05525 [Lentilactobacillus sp. IMAU92037]|uniref:DUF5776 domain-containing protein n=1 Tax=Lentilactobacillus dabitei TaxID=2831523 RepID=UPI001C2BB34A|nr:DUF5776 domain-containing protein [Lentilactobacillus dabitei]MBV0930175.1 hypothetical protein [Lentilactobacillus dabitei]